MNNILYYLQSHGGQIYQWLLVIKGMHYLQVQYVSENANNGRREKYLFLLVGYLKAAGGSLQGKCYRGLCHDLLNLHLAYTQLTAP